MDLKCLFAKGAITRVHLLARAGLVGGLVCGSSKGLCCPEDTWRGPGSGTSPLRSKQSSRHGALKPAAAPCRVSLRLTEIKFPWVQVPNSAVLFLLKCNCFSLECAVTAQRQEDVWKPPLQFSIPFLPDKHGRILINQRATLFNKNLLTYKWLFIKRPLIAGTEMMCYWVVLGD